MAVPDPQSTRHWFHSYAADFAAADGELPAMQQLKYDHCFRVAEDSRILAVAMQWAPEDTDLAEIIGLYHDVGRFSQYAEFGTFADARSVNHAQRGVEVLTTSDALADFAAEHHALILDAVGGHNLPTINGDIAADSLPFLKLARDADKLDICFVVDDALRNDKVHLYPEITLHVDLNGRPNPDVIAAVSERRHVIYSQIGSLADMLLVQLTWMYDLQFSASLKLVQERGILDNLAEHLKPYPETTGVQTAVRAYVRSRASAARTE